MNQIVPVEKEITPLVNEGSSLAERLQQLEVTNDEQQAVAIDSIAKIRQFIKKVEERRKAFTKPLKDHIKWIDLQFKEPLKPIEQAEAHINKELLHYRNEQARLRAIEQEKARIKAEKEAEKLAAKGIQAPVPETVPDLVDEQQRKFDMGDSKAHYRIDWTFEIVDESLIPREYLKVDEVAIGGVVRAMKDKTNIPGIRAFGKEVLVTGR